jgi:hypothetical protein
VDHEVDAERPTSLLSDRPATDYGPWSSVDPEPASAPIGQRLADAFTRIPAGEVLRSSLRPNRFLAAKLGVAAIVVGLTVTFSPHREHEIHQIAGGVSVSGGEAEGTVSARDADARSLVGSQTGSAASGISLTGGNGPSDASTPFVIDLAELTGLIQLDPALNIDDGRWIEPKLEPESEWVDGGNGVALPDILLRIRFCESTNNYAAAHTNSSARGAYQFLTMSWEYYGHAERYGVPAANLATPAQQDEAALITLEAQGARPWAESRACWDDPDIDPRYRTAGPPPAPVTTTTRPPSSTTTSPPSTTTTAPSSTTTTAPSTTTTTAPTTTTTTATSTTPN